ncbi:MAG: hypothetical protein WBB45_21230 [Cyclobacteriaceae bacterium]
MKTLIIILFTCFSSLFASTDIDEVKASPDPSEAEQFNIVRIWGVFPSSPAFGSTCFTITDCEEGQGYDIYGSIGYFVPGETYEIYLYTGSSQPCANYELAGADGPIGCGIHQI